MTNSSGKIEVFSGDLIILDSDSFISSTYPNSKILYWSRFADEDKGDQLSIVDLVEKNSNDLKSRYLSWIYDVGEAKINGKRVIDHLTIRPGFSYWWLTSFAQKFNCSGKSEINDSIKFLALTDLIATNNFSTINLHTSNHLLAKVISSLCNKKNLKFKLNYIRPKSLKILKKLFKHLPEQMKAFLYLIRYFIHTFPLNFIKQAELKYPFSDLTFFDIFVHLDKQSFEHGRFISNYWTNLVCKLSEMNLKANWMHIFFRHSNVSSMKDARKLVNKFTLSSMGNEVHNLLERPLSIKLYSRVILDYFRLLGSYKKLKSISGLSIFEFHSELWEFHIRDWKASICGSEAATACIKMSLFSNFLGNLPTQKMGIYLSENQPWEMILIHQWKYYGHGKIVGVPHSVIRHWDLRYFYDPRTYKNKRCNKLPLPDILALNGPVAKKVLIENQYPINRILEVEALRFLYLNKLSKSSGFKLKNTYPKKNRHVLICGDFKLESTQNLINWIMSAKCYLKANLEFTFKPHPACPTGLLNTENFRISNSPLSDLIATADIIVTSLITSAAVDGYLSKVPVIQIHDGSTFNTSPLLNFGGLYAKNPQHLGELILLLETKKIKTNEYFNLNHKLSAWKKLLISK